MALFTLVARGEMRTESTTLLRTVLGMKQSTPAYGGRPQPYKCHGHSYLQPGLREPEN